MYKKDMMEDEDVQANWKLLQVSIGDLYFNMINNGRITIQGKTMRFQCFPKGKQPKNGYTLIFGLHGGGGCEPEVNQKQFQRHKTLYDPYLPDGCIWVACRSCEEASDMWWKSYIPSFLEIIIKGLVLRGMVDPNKVFVTGYSAGGDGVYHLGPMLPDWWAGAAMMAGHPNDVELYNIRNLAFSIQMGGKDEAYNRNSAARKYINKMNKLHTHYGGYSIKYCNVYEQCSHWMDFNDTKIFCNFFSEERDPYPEFLVFKQHPRVKRQYFYFIQVDPDLHKEIITVRKNGNMYIIESQKIPVTIYLNRKMVNFSQQVAILHNNKKTVARKPKKDVLLIQSTIRQRADPQYIFEDYFVSIPQTSIYDK